MLGRKLERDAQLLRLPQYETIGERALGGDLGRTLLPDCVEEPGEQHRPVANRDPRRRARRAARSAGTRTARRSRNTSRRCHRDGHPRRFDAAATRGRSAEHRASSARRRARSTPRSRRACAGSPGNNPQPESITQTLMQGEANFVPPVASGAWRRHSCGRERALRRERSRDARHRRPAEHIGNELPGDAQPGHVDARSRCRARRAGRGRPRSRRLPVAPFA